ncbi:Crp/Fnr family transcriptional regulator [Aurantibacillus circumpalustris]|uniref:Crp/Fnr family transcriptional regulator n=1 Tax=Aurantibacillus circumpalustris TaxID=3036359 RepID=UPI00295B79F1|nr:Crp/Fnr family transcriptional regulator [Aurantibacillus circumpalustris]
MLSEILREKLAPIFEKQLVDEILKLAEITQVKEGEVVMDYGKKVRFMPIVISGTLRVMRKDEEGREIILYYLSSNESCAMAYACCMESKLSEVKAIAEDNAEIIKIPHEKLDEWLMKYPSWKSYIFSSFTQRFNELLRSLESVAFKKLDERLVNYLKDKAKVFGKSAIQLSHSQIAEEMGTSRVVISRLLKQLENEKKLILYRNEIKLLSGF